MTNQIKSVAVCGAGGTMGTGIAIVSARAGYPTIAFDRDETILDRVKKQASAFFAKSVERGKLAAEEGASAMENLSFTTRIEDLSQCDFVIEAVFEDLTVKQELLGRLDEVCGPDAIFGSNTSTISITEIASGCSRPERVVGIHFCLPAQLMKLVEMSPGMLTAKETFDRAWAWAEAAGQIPVRTEDKPGFILNALLVPFNNDAIRAVEARVAEPADIDRAIKAGLGYKIGPLALIDLVGLDTQVRLCEAFYPVTLDPRASAPPLLRRMVAAGLLGRKTGRGFFTYDSSGIFGA